MKIRPKNWREFQHYKDRSPPWIRLHRKLLDNREFHRLPIESKALAPMLWLLASESVDGAIDDNREDLAFRLRCTEEEISRGLDPLLERGFFVDAADAAEADEDLTPSQAMAQHNGFGTRHISDATKRVVWARDGGKCVHCQGTGNLEYDHKTPVSKGGTSDETNVQLLCRTCNRKKRTKTAEQVATQAQPTDTYTLGRRTHNRGNTEAEESGASPALTPLPEDSPPPGLDLAAWSRWLEYRKGIKKPIKGPSIPAAQRDMAKLNGQQAEAVEFTIAKGWIGLRCPDPQKPQTGGERGLPRFNPDSPR